VLYLAGIYACAVYPEGHALALLDAARLLVVWPFQYIALSMKTLFKSNEGQKSRVAPALIGVGAAVPVLFIAGALLSKGDAAFAGTLGQVWHIVGESVGQLILSVLFFFPLFSLLFALNRNEELPRPKPVFQSQTSAKGLEPMVIAGFLGAVSLLYLAYLFSQLAYVTNAFQGVLPKGYTFAQYARRGFFELCAVAAINLLLVILSAALVKKRTDRAKLPMTAAALCSFVCVFTLLLIAAAEAKMVIYVHTYGMTRMRLMVALFILLLAFAFVLLLVWICVRRLAYLKPMLAACCVLLLAMSCTGVDHIVLRYNMWAYETGRLQKLDVTALRELGEARIPYLIQLTKTKNKTMRYEALMQLHDYVYYGFPPERKDAENVVVYGLRQLQKNEEAKGWSQWNYTHAQAIRALTAWADNKNCPLRTEAYYCYNCERSILTPRDHDVDCWQRILDAQGSGAYYCYDCGRVIAAPEDHGFRYGEELCPGNPRSKKHKDWCGECLYYTDNVTYDERGNNITGHQRFCSKHGEDYQEYRVAGKK
jgi:hypothetical protein